MTAFVFYFLLQDITLVSTLAISPVTLGDSGVYTCQSGVDSGAVANVTVIVTSGKQNSDTIQDFILVEQFCLLQKCHFLFTIEILRTFDLFLHILPYNCVKSPIYCLQYGKVLRYVSIGIWIQEPVIFSFIFQRLGIGLLDFLF